MEASIPSLIIFSPIIFIKKERPFNAKTFVQAITVYFQLVIICSFHNLHVLFYLTDSLSEIYSDISCTSLGVNFTFCIFTGEATSVVLKLHDWAILNNDWHLRQLSEPRLR